MKKLLIAAIVAAPLSAFAEDNITQTIGIEKALETEVTTGYLDTKGAWGPISSTLGLNWKDTAADQLDMNFSSVELDVGYTFDSGVTVYANNDWDDDFKHTETTVGAKFKF